MSHPTKWHSPQLAAIAPRAGMARPVVRTILALAALAAIVLAVMDPRWGAQVEVLEPFELRERVRKEAAALVSSHAGSPG